MTAKELFKVAFLYHAAEQGLTPAQMREKISSARDEIEKSAGVEQALANMFSTGASWGIPLAVVGPPLAGAVGGAALAKLRDADNEDVEDYKRRELVGTLKDQAHELMTNTALRDFAAKQKVRTRPIL